MIRLRCFLTYTFLSFCILMLYLACKPSGKDNIEENWESMEVTVSAFNSVKWQTEGNPALTAFGDTLKPGMAAIAVSRDLLQKGMDYNTEVKIEGFDQTFLVKDKMHYRWKNKIDIYMGNDVQKARKFGRKKMIIQYKLKDSIVTLEKD